MSEPQPDAQHAADEDDPAGENNPADDAIKTAMADVVRSAFCQGGAFGEHELAGWLSKPTNRP